eukprot:645759-Prorocentrum_minimum.AAC.3
MKRPYVRSHPRSACRRPSRSSYPNFCLCNYIVRVGESPAEEKGHPLSHRAQRPPRIAARLQEEGSDPTSRDRRAVDPYRTSPPSSAVKPVMGHPPQAEPKISCPERKLSDQLPRYRVIL